MFVTLALLVARVVQQTIKETLPEDFGTSQFQKNKGQIDLIVERKYLNSMIGTLLNVLLKKAEAKDKQSNVSVDKSIQTALITNYLTNR